MGLDIYLTRFDEDMGTVLAVERRYEERCGAEVYGDGGPSTPEERREACGRIARELGLTDGGEHPAKHRIGEPSKVAPDNINGLGYFRSPYNSGGINRVVERLTGESKGYYWIFQKESDDYYHRPDWAEARRRAMEVIGDLERVSVQNRGYAVRTLRMAPHHTSSESAALAEFLKFEGSHANIPAGFGRAFANGYGDFDLDGMDVRAVMLGIESSLFGKQPVAYVVTKSPDGSALHPSYIDSLKVVVETCDYVLASDAPERFALAWSE